MHALQEIHLVRVQRHLDDLPLGVPVQHGEEVLQLVSRLAEIAPEWKSTGTPPLLKLDGQNIWIPDVELREQNTGKKAFIEIIGPWRSGYLARRLETLKKAGETEAGSFEDYLANITDGNGTCEWI